jgi:murein DD-endopeptidase MepM/ murein hydrolase activator NlpD
VGFKWNLGSDDDLEPKVADEPETGSIAFAALGLDFRDEESKVPADWSIDQAVTDAPAPMQPVVPTAAIAPVDAPAVTAPAETSAVAPIAPLTRRALREAALRGGTSLGELAAEPLVPAATMSAESTSAESSVPEPVELAAEPSAFVFAAADATVHPAAASRRSAAATRPKGRTKYSRAPKAVAATAPLKKRHGLFSKLTTIGAMLGVAGLMISTSLPANAFYSDDFLGTTSAAEVGPAQTLEVKQDVAPAVATRDGYTVASLAEQMRLKYGSRAYAYTNNPLGTIQWPFPIPVPIASGYGDRFVPNCGYCSTFHQGVDFTPGAGAPIQAIADGVVIGINSTPGGLGQHVVIEHTINGQKIQSWYAHMLTGSIRVTQGQVVKVGEQVGQVGSTGASTGAHLHLEIHVEGVPVDPFQWLKANAN